MREVAPGMHVVERPQRFLGFELGSRMTVMQLGDDLLVHSPVAVPPETLAPLGRVRWVLAPNLFHHLHVGPWIEAGAESSCPAGLPRKRRDLRFDRVIEEPGAPYGPEVQVIPLECFSLTREIVVLHRPTRTLIVTDLVFHIPADAPWATRVGMRCVCGYPGCRTTLLERLGMRRDIARREVGGLLDLDFDRLVMSHGTIIDRGGREALASAFAWLL